MTLEIMSVLNSIPVLPPEQDIVICFLTHAKREMNVTKQTSKKPPNLQTKLLAPLTLTYRFIISCIKCSERRAKGTSHSLL